MTSFPRSSPAPRAETRAVRAAIATDQEHGAVVPPIHLTTTFAFAGFNEKRTYDYTRSGNPTRDHLGQAIAALEEGVNGIVTSTGMSAVALALRLAEPGDRVIAPNDCYGGTWRLLSALARRREVEVEFIPMSEDGALARALDQGSARLVWIETPSNPLLRISDIRSLSAVAHERGAVVVADNTFLSPALQRPLTLGADVVVHSTTKYLNGHSDVVGGAVVARDPVLHEELAWWANCLGLTGSPFDSFLTLRGLRTLHARMRCHLENTSRIVELLESSPAVSRVWYPGLRDHPGHRVASAQQDGFGAIVSFELRGGVQAVRAFVDGLRHITLAESLGGVESLVAHPATMTHASMDAAARAAAGITDGMLRLSVGIEHADDLLGDLDDALERARPAIHRNHADIHRSDAVIIRS